MVNLNASVKKKTTYIATKNVHGNRSEGSDFFNTKESRLHLSDGATFTGNIPAWQAEGTIGEVVFNTGMTGYTESLTDPSYAGQILVFTYPMIGNYGVDESTMESSKIQVKGVVIDTLEHDWSHKKSSQSFLQWLHGQNIPIMFDVDTRAVTKYLRTRGTMAGSIGKSKEKLKDISLDATFVSINKPIDYAPRGRKKVIVVDCGTKDNIIRSLRDLPITVRRVPHDFDYSDEEFDAVFVTNGPGNPEDYKTAISTLKKVMKTNKPIFGICLGNQLLALAAGAKTYKMKFGHRGHNQPCINVEDERCYITSQNHGYAIDDKSLPKGWKVTYRNLNDNSVEGIAHDKNPFSSVQFHPEACPGPTDTEFLFKTFYEVIK